MFILVVLVFIFYEYLILKLIFFNMWFINRFYNVFCINVIRLDYVLLFILINILKCCINKLRKLDGCG